MEAKELRIGNLVREFGEIKKIEVHGVNVVTSDIFNSEIGDIPIHVIEGISLTEEWLLKFGFELFDDFQFRKNGIYFTQSKEGQLTCFHNTYVLRHIKHVHELQNLHYSLTQTELTFS